MGVTFLVLTALLVGGVGGACWHAHGHRRRVGMQDGGCGDSRLSHAAARDAVQEELRESQERMRAILDTTVDAIVTADEKGTILSCNRAAEKLFGYTAAEMLNRNVSLLMPNPHRERHDAYMQRYLRTGQSRIIGVGREVVALRKDGARLPVDLALSDAMVNGAHFFTAVIRDIGERKRLEAGMVAANEQVRQEIGQELHDALGQQLTGISLLAKTLNRQLAARGDALQKDAAAVVDLSRQAVEQVRNLSHGLYPVNLRRLGLGGALQELAETTAHGFGIEFPVEVDETAAKLPEHAALHFYRIAQEATNNAIRHAKATRISISLRSDGDAVELCIQDNGPGLPSPPATAAGMGLSIMAYRASLLGAMIEYRSAPESGLAVICRRPIPEPEA